MAPTKNYKSPKSVQTASQLHDIPVTSSIRGFKYLTLQGGGMKGIGDIDALEKLEKTGVLAQIEEIAGSSAGGIVATLAAVGCTTKEIREFMLNLDFRSFQDKEVGWVESTHLKTLLKGGAALGDEIQDKVKALKSIPLVGGLIKGTITPYVEPVGQVLKYGKMAASAVETAEKAEEIANLALGGDLGIWQGDALFYWLAEIIARKTGNPNITFKELAALADAPGSPYKKLHLTGSNLTDGISEYYNAINKPDMPILRGARISASFPGAFKPVVTIEEGADGKEKRVVRVDGGLLENLPDVFNKPPYYSSKKGEANPQVLAISFKVPEEEETKDIKNGIDLARALYDTKMSEKKLIEKYGPNIAFVDTLGVGTLELDASEERRMKLAESGGVAVTETFNKILENEQKEKKKDINYDNFSNEDLVRIITELSHSKRAEDNKALVNFNRALQQRHLPKDKLKTLKKDAEKSYLRKLKLVDPIELTDSELSDICVARREELSILENQLKQKLEKLKNAKNVFEANQTQIELEFRKNREFYDDLSRVKGIHKRLDEVQGEKIRTNNLEDKAFLKQECKALKEELDDFYNKIISKYNEKSKPFISAFFEKLRKDKDKPHFSVPGNLIKLQKYCLEDVKETQALIEEAEKQLSKTRGELHSFKRHKVAFEGRKNRSKQFSDLLHLKTELEKTINRETGILIKINRFFAQKAPQLQIITRPILKAASFLTFICGTLPVRSVKHGIVKLFGKLIKDEGRREAIKNMVELFSSTDIDLDQKLRGLKEMTVKCIKIMQNNYVEIDSEKMTALRALHASYLKDSEIDLEKIFVKKSDESDKNYQARIKEIKESYKSLEPNEQMVYETLEVLEETLKAEKELPNIRSEGTQNNSYFNGYRSQIIEQLALEEGDIEIADQFFTIPSQEIDVEYSEDGVINTTLPDSLEELKQIFPAIVKAWTNSNLEKPILNGRMKNLEYMTKEFLKQGIIPDFEEEALEFVKEAYETEEGFIAHLKTEIKQADRQKNRSARL